MEIAKEEIIYIDKSVSDNVRPVACVGPLEAHTNCRSCRTDQCLLYGCDHMQIGS